ncbi:MAG: DUF3393 domain-containing protein [Proteobacteria bacterium]|nr:DUF3393 domain-containing protein [Pseudomonadota bacterium]
MINTPGLRIASCLVLAMFTIFDAGCATTRIVESSIQRVVNRQPVDRESLKAAVSTDTRALASNVQQLSRRFAEALAQLRARVRARWGQNDDKVADRTTYVKYTYGYQNRVITDFERG